MGWVYLRAYGAFNYFICTLWFSGRTTYQAVEISYHSSREIFWGRKGLEDVALSNFFSELTNLGRVPSYIHCRGTNRVIFRSKIQEDRQSFRYCCSVFHLGNRHI